MQTHGQAYTSGLFPCVNREDTQTQTHTLHEVLLYQLFLTKSSHVLRLEHSQIYSISHTLNGPTSTLIVAHAITHTRTCLCTLLDTH